MFLGERGEQMFKLLLMKAEELGRAPTMEEVKADSRLPEPNDYAYYFGSFTEAIKEVNAKLKFQTPEDGPVIKRRVLTDDPVVMEELRKSREWSLAPMRFLEQQREKRRKALRLKIDREQEVGKVAKNKLTRLSEERQEEVLAEIVEMYVKSNGEMPSARMVKKNPYISEEEVEALKRSGVMTEDEIQKRAEALTGQKFTSSEEKRRRKAQMMVDLRNKQQAKQQAEQQAAQLQADVAQEQEVEKMEVKGAKEVKEVKEVKKTRVRRGKITAEIVLADLRAIGERLGHIPTQAEINRAENGAGYAYATYLKFLGPKAQWPALLDADKDVDKGAEKAPEVSETPEAPETPEIPEVPETPEAPEVPKEEMICEPEVALDEVGVLEMRVVEIPLKVILPKNIKGQITLTLELD